MTTIKDICKETGLSTATVSRVLNGSPLVAEETRQRVAEAMKRLGYRPHHVARSLKLNRTGMIAVVFPDIDHGFFTEVLRGADQRASEDGFHLLTVFSHGAMDHCDLVARVARERRADALVLMNLTIPDSFFREFADLQAPIVLIDRPSRIHGIGSISIDNVGGVEAMIAHLADRGFRRIAFVAGPKGTYDADQRLSAFRRVMKSRNLEVDAALVWSGDFTERSGARAVEDYLRRGGKLPDAIFAANDAMAVGIHQFLKERNIGVPRDVALAGFDDIPTARFLDLTTIRVPMRDLGRRAVDMALRLIQDRDERSAARHELLATELVIRGSTRRTLPMASAR